MPNENENRDKEERPADFGLPQGYFQRSASTLMNRLEWQEEHREYKLLLELKDQSGFHVPHGYFNEVEHQLELLNYTQLEALRDKDHGFAIPLNYFETALTHLGADTGEGDLLPFIPKQNAFAIPANYFNERETSLKALLTSEKKQARIIYLFSLPRVAAAAAALLIILGFWAYDFYFKTQETNDCGTIACIDRKELLNTKAIDNLETEELYELVNSKKLEENLKDQNTDKTKGKDTAGGLKEDAVDDLLDGI